MYNYTKHSVSGTNLQSIFTRIRAQKGVYTVSQRVQSSVSLFIQESIDRCIRRRKDFFPSVCMYFRAQGAPYYKRARQYDNGNT